MKFVGSIKGKHFLIDPENYETEIREKIAKDIENIDFIPMTENQTKPEAIIDAVLKRCADIARGEK